MTKEDCYKVSHVLRVRAIKARNEAHDMLDGGADKAFHYYDGARQALEDAADAFDEAAEDTRVKPRNRRV